MRQKNDVSSVALFLVQMKIESTHIMNICSYCKNRTFIEALDSDNHSIRALLICQPVTNGELIKPERYSTALNCNP